MYRQFFDTSFNDHRQIRVVLQELPHNSSKELSSDFQRFCTSIFQHKNFTYEQFKLEYCFVKENLIITEKLLNEIQLYRRPFAFLFFTICHTSEQLRIVLDEYAKIKQQEKGVYFHLFVQYKTINNDDGDQDDISNDEEVINRIEPQSDYIVSSRPSISSMTSVEFYRTTSLKFQDSTSIDGSGSDRISLTDSLNSMPTFSAITTDTLTNDDRETSLSLDQSKSSRFSLFKDKNMSTGNLFQLFDSDLTRILHCLEANLTKHVLETEKYNTFESQGFNNYASPIDSQLADIRLMMDCEKDCSLLENQSKYRHGYFNDPIFKSVLNEFDMRVMCNLLNQYLKANINITTETGKNKLTKKLIDTRTIKRKADCCLLLGAIDKAHTDYRNVADALKSQNDSIWHAAALEARIAASYVSIQKPKRQIRKSLPFLRQNSLHRIERYLNRSNAPIDLRDRMDLALQIYNAANRTSFNFVTFRLELDVCLRWCSLLWEQNDLKKYRNDIDLYITRINRLGSYLEEHIDSIYLNAYLAETYDFIGLKRKSALYYRSAAFSGLTLMGEQECYNDEIDFFCKLIKRARTGYGIDDNLLIFPLLQKTIINESIQISLKNDDFTTIIQNVHFAIESLIEFMSDPELQALLTFLNASKESIACAYCSIPRLKSLELLPLSNRLKAWKFEPIDDIFIYHRVKPLPKQHESLHRKVDFYWVKNEQVQIVLEVENYLPGIMIIDQLEFLTNNNQLFTKLETKYRVPARMKKRLTIDCIPKEIGQLRIQGLRYHTWSTNQEFRFGDYSTIRHCICSVDIVNELPILDLQYFLINENKIELSNTSIIYNGQVYHGEDVFVTFGLINSSNECSINTLEIQVLISGIDMTDSIKITQLDLPIMMGNNIEIKIDITELYDRCISRKNVEMLNIEFRINYSNELTNTEGYYRRHTIEFCLNYLSPITFQINNIENDEDDLSYLMVCTIENHLLEDILIQNHIIKSLNSSLITIKQNKIQLNTFPSNINQLINDTQIQLPTFIYYKTIDSNKQLRLPIDLKYFLNEKIQNNFNILIQLPFTYYWHFEKIMNTLHIYLCVISKFDKFDKLEFIFSLKNNIRFLNSNKIQFNNIQPGEYLIAERVLIFSQENSSNELVVNVNINEMIWKTITLTF